MTPELINKRFAELQKMENEHVQSIQSLQNQLQQAQVDLNSINGAKIDCQYWLQQVALANPPAFVPNAEVQVMSARDADLSPAPEAINTPDETVN